MIKEKHCRVHGNADALPEMLNRKSARGKILHPMRGSLSASMPDMRLR
jgi:hypothetical protein